MPDMPDMPEERVGLRITSDPDETRIEQPATHGARETVPLPLRLLFAAPLTPRIASGEARPVRVDRHRFAEMMQQFDPRLAITVPNRINDASQEMAVELSFLSLKAFRPEEIARRVPALHSLLALRTLVRRARDGEIDGDGFRTEAQQAGIEEARADAIYQMIEAPEEPSASEKPSTPRPSPSAAAGDDASLDRLMGMVEAEGEAPPSDAAGEQTGGAMDTLMRAVSEEGAKPAVEASAAERLMADLDGVLRAQTGAILRHPEVRRLEAAWRGLKFLVDRLDVRAGIQLEVLPVAKADLGKALHHRVLLPEHARQGDKPPISAVVLDFSFDHRDADVALLRDLAGTAASLQAPIIGSVAPVFFGKEAPGQLGDLPLVRQHLEGPAYLAWNKLRDEQGARFLALALPPFLLRAPYGAEKYDGELGTEEDDGLWGGGARAVAVALAGSFARTGWPTHFAGGPLRERHIEDLPVHQGPGGHGPLAARYGEEQQAELAEAGSTVRGARPDHDAAYVARALTLARPQPEEDAEAQAGARAHVSLPCQLFVTRAAHALLTFQADLAPGTAPDEAQATLEQRLRTFLQAEDEGDEDENAVSIEPVEGADVPGHTLLAVRLRPPASALEQDVSLVMGVQVAERETG